MIDAQIPKIIIVIYQWNFNFRRLFMQQYFALKGQYISGEWRVKSDTDLLSTLHSPINVLPFQGD
jgi:hypothetical protein